MAALAGLGLFLGCAQASVQPDPALSPKPLLPIPRSSIAAVLTHRGELDLTDEQLQRLQLRDETLDREQVALREAYAKQRPPKPIQEAAAPTTPSFGGRQRGQTRAPTPEVKPAVKTLEEQLDENDTRAYLAAEAEILTAKQVDAAREVASKYREDLYDRREQLRNQQRP